MSNSKKFNIKDLKLDQNAFEIQSPRKMMQLSSERSLMENILYKTTTKNNISPKLKNDDINLFLEKPILK